MKCISVSRPTSFSLSYVVRVTAAFVLAASLGACTSTRLEDAAPQVAPAADQAQITPDERDAFLAEIDAARAGQRPPGRTRVELSTGELRAIARGHAEEALEAIEGE